MRRTLLWSVLLCIGASGCGRAPEKPAETTPPATPPVTSQPSAVRTVVEGITGKTAVDQGIQARERIKAISAREQRDLNEALQP